MNREQVEAAARELLAAECGASPVLFDSVGVVVILSRPGDGRRQRPSRSFHLMCFGSGLLIAVAEQHFEWAESTLSGMTRDDILSLKTLDKIRARIEHEQPGWELTPPALKFLCASESIRHEIKIPGMEVKIGDAAQFAELYSRTAELPNVLSTGGPGSDNTLAVVYSGGRPIAAAGSWPEFGTVFDIGVDTLPGDRHKGAAKFAVWQLTRHLLNKSEVPLYSTQISNLASQRVALGVGYWPAWLEVFARPAAGNQADVATPP
jgi:hypothetical protein